MEAENEDNRTPLFAATFYGHFDVVKFLHENGAKLEVRTQEGGYTPLIVAAQQRHLEVLKFLIQKGISIGKKHALKKYEQFVLNTS